MEYNEMTEQEKKNFIEREVFCDYVAKIISKRNFPNINYSRNKEAIEYCEKNNINKLGYSSLAVTLITDLLKENEILTNKFKK